MNDQARRLRLGDDLARRLASAIRSAQLYATAHPLVGRNVNALADTLKEIHANTPAVAVGFVDDDIVVGDVPLPKPVSSVVDLARRLRARGVERIAFEKGVTAEELGVLVRHLAKPPNGADQPETDLPPGVPHVRVGRIAVETQVETGFTDMATIRRLYADAVSAVETIWDDVRQEGRLDARAAQNIVHGLAQAVAQNRSALLALTAVKNHDNYTFTHMVNVSILGMAQARALGIDGPLLREFGIAALMHDIGKVRVPLEILQKPGRLTDSELVVMRRHPVDGAEILRRTPDIPQLVPLVAFEHHLRLDGTGYPFGITRPSLNLATVLTSIADVYDAMRSQRVYQNVFPSERVVEVLRGDDGRHFDQHVVRRFVQLLGIYPTGTAVRLDTGHLAVVVKINASDPHRPRVRVVQAPDGAAVPAPYDVDLWTVAPGEGVPATVAAPVDAETVGIDPLAHM
jgi:putative nucleotidyltransferase with HDIG domain